MKDILHENGERNIEQAVQVVDFTSGEMNDIWIPYKRVGVKGNLSVVKASLQ